MQLTEVTLDCAQTLIQLQKEKICEKGTNSMIY
jgi:hypothetical protein